MYDAEGKEGESVFFCIPDHAETYLFAYNIMLVFFNLENKILRSRGFCKGSLVPYKTKTITNYLVLEILP